ncbi:MAG: FAD-linked oxidase [Acidobacteria bacterium]|nr:MAG: FAD-linked oxidase [Acidobacteriota bacterium]
MQNLNWGRYPYFSDYALHRFRNEGELKGLFKTSSRMIPIGNGRSYGDSALACDLIETRQHAHFLSFNASTGHLRVQAGVMLADILAVFVPRGWFLKVTPGTKLITVGGAIASDVHGKNHHRVGCFSECVEHFRLMLPGGDIVTCSRHEHGDLFKATCGGMGLTGVILDAVIQLVKIPSHWIAQKTIKTGNLKETFDAFEKAGDASYSVAWIDCFAPAKKTGRCHLMVGEFLNHAKDREFKSNSERLGIPVDLPAGLLNKWTMRAFNCVFYNRQIAKEQKRTVSLNSFFYPLDHIKNWNRLYGKRGFTQYQFIFPRSSSYDGLDEILKCIALSGRGSFLAVLKLYGRENDNLLSFPMEGYSMALDFKIEQGLFSLLEKLDAIVLRHGGRVYLAKDARVPRSTFEKGYAKIDRFRAIRRQYNMKQTLNSLQSLRLGL